MMITGTAKPGASGITTLGPPNEYDETGWMQMPKRAFIYIALFTRRSRRLARRPIGDVDTTAIPTQAARLA